jgi:hypothetical protein
MPEGGTCRMMTFIGCRAIDRCEISVGGIEHQSQLGASQDDRVDAVALDQDVRETAQCGAVLLS